MGGSGENVQLRIYAGSVNTDPSGLEGFSTSAGLPGNSHCPVFFSFFHHRILLDFSSDSVHVY